MAEITYQMVLSTLQTTGILVGIAYYVMNLNYTRRNQEQTLRTRHATIYHQIMYPVVSIAGMKNILLLQANPVSSFEEYQKLTSSNNEFRVAWFWMCNLCEMIGIYLRQGVADIEFFAMHQPHWNLRFWRQAKPIIYKLRERLGPSHYRNMEYLFDSLEKYLEEHPEIAP
jgi:hypothetical protein